MLLDFIVKSSKSPGKHRKKRLDSCIADNSEILRKNVRDTSITQTLKCIHAYK